MLTNGVIGAKMIRSERYVFELGGTSLTFMTSQDFGLGSLVLYTFANAHLAYLGTDVDIVNEKPIGALLLSMQVV
jgi:hypothetical protein